MNLCGEIVIHKAFGKGKIVKCEQNYVVILFDETMEEKKFVYPAAFGQFLQLENTALLKDIEEEKIKIVQKEAENKKATEERANVMKSKKNLGNSGNAKVYTTKSTDKNNIAFKCNYCDGGKSNKVVGYKGVCTDEIIKYNIKVAKHIWCSQPENKCFKYLSGEISRDEITKFYNETKFEFSKSVCYESQMFEIWTAGAGVTQNGDDKGKPMSLRNVKPNSLALLTSKLPYADDSERFIFAVFLINENYEGDSREEGHVGANPKYRLHLSLDEAKKLKFWDYYFNPNKPEKIVFGSGLHRYITDIQASQVLNKICEIKKGTSEEKFAKEFLEHYCFIKELDIKNIPTPNGALQRTMG
ncbi:hypothetical protein [Serpentinicella alkaliphila]|uniref:Uncharacterized protein n=1 Tax=Serpentinicella alkaliphila TaxID=1734049 RepID=A0A4R2TG27_9FIRM|nr:hypothetical protein [Serpentinicella alkaliphila]TCP96168.1 hypothetical protein EDD79_10532 [Serpentinicella alkaliphila]